MKRGTAAAWSDEMNQVIIVFRVFRFLKSMHSAVVVVDPGYGGRCWSPKAEELWGLF